MGGGSSSRSSTASEAHASVLLGISWRRPQRHSKGWLLVATSTLACTRAQDVGLTLASFDGSLTLLHARCSCTTTLLRSPGAPLALTYTLHLCTRFL